MIRRELPKAGSGGGGHNLEEDFKAERYLALIEAWNLINKLLEGDRVLNYGVKAKYRERLNAEHIAALRLERDAIQKLRYDEELTIEKAVQDSFTEGSKIYSFLVSREVKAMVVTRIEEVIHIEKLIAIRKKPLKPCCTSPVKKG